MFCTKCGKELNDSAKFCTACGEPVKRVAAVPKVEQSQTQSASKLEPKPERMTEPKTEGSKKEKKSKTPIIIIICVIVALVIVASGAIGVVIYQRMTLIEDTEREEKNSDREDEDNGDAEEEPTATPMPTPSPTPEFTETPTEAPTLAPTEEAEEEIQSANTYYSSTPSAAFDNYMKVFIEAVNTGDFSNAGMVMKIGSEIYDQQKNIVTHYHKQGITERVLSYAITKTEQLEDGSMRLTSNEEIEVTYSDGSAKVVEQSYAYICVQEGQKGWLFTNMEAVSEAEKEDTAKVTTESGEDDYILPESNSRYYTKKEIAKLSKKQLRLARNEIFARYGYKFKDDEMNKYFKSKSWYKAKKKIVSESDLNKYEKANLKKIQKREKKLK